MSTVAVTPEHGKWGWYALSRSECLEVKEYHRLLLRDRRATKRWWRWNAKRPENRKGSAPRCYGTDAKTYKWVLEEYRKVRHPVDAPEKVAPVDLPEDWRHRAAELTEFYK